MRFPEPNKLVRRDVTWEVAIHEANVQPKVFANDKRLLRMPVGGAGKGQTISNTTSNRTLRTKERSFGLDLVCHRGATAGGFCSGACAHDARYQQQQAKQRGGSAAAAHGKQWARIAVSEPRSPAPDQPCWTRWWRRARKKVGTANVRADQTGRESGCMDVNKNARYGIAVDRIAQRRRRNRSSSTEGGGRGRTRRGSPSLSVLSLT